MKSRLDIIPASVKGMMVFGPCALLAAGAPPEAGPLPRERGLEARNDILFCEDLMSSLLFSSSSSSFFL